MKVQLESTAQIVTLNGVPARVWEGTTEGGTPVTAFVTRIAVDRDHDSAEFDKELRTQRVPSVAWPAAMVL